MNPPQAGAPVRPTGPTGAAPHGAQLPDRMLAPSAIAWALYDVGYLCFTFALFSRLLAPWFINELGHPDWYFALAQLATALALIVLMPAFGAVADAAGRRKPFLALFTLGAAASVTMLGGIPIDSSDPVAPTLIIASVTAMCTALAFAQFEPLLSLAAPPRLWGAVSGMAVGVGVIAAAAWLFPLTLVATERGTQAAFAPGAALLVGFMLPLLLFVREPGRSGASTIALLRASAHGVRHALGQLRRTFGHMRRHEGIGRLVVARFLYTDAIGTVNVYLAVYLGYIGTFTQYEITMVLALAVVFTAVGALVAGRVVTSHGPRLPLLWALPLYVIALAVTGLSGAEWAVWAVAPIGGLTLGTVWTADRVFMLNLAPPELRGELFGLFNLVGRAAQSAAPLVLWGGVNWLLHDGTGWTSELTAARVSLVLLAATALIGMLVLRPLDDRVRHAD